MNLKRVKDFELEDICEEEEILKKRFIADFSRLKICDIENTKETARTEPRERRTSNNVVM